MAGLRAPWASRDEALFWLQMAGMAAVGGLAVALAATLAWALLLQPAVAWWHGQGLRVATDAATWGRWARHGGLGAAALFAPFLAFFVWYADGMLRGSGKAEP